MTASRSQIRKYSDRALRRRGLSLVEMAIVICVIGILLGAVWMISYTVSQAHKVNELVRQATEGVNTIRDRFTSNSSFPAAPAPPWGGSGTDVTDLFGEGTGSAITPLHLLPVEMSQGAGVYHDIFGGAFNVLIIGFPTAADTVDTMRFEMQSIPTTACVQAIAQLPVSENSIGIVRILVNGVVLNNVTGYTGPGGTVAWATAWPLPVATISAACNGTMAGSAGPNEIDIDFKLHP